MNSERLASLFSVTDMCPLKLMCDHSGAIQVQIDINNTTPQVLVNHNTEGGSASFFENCPKYRD
jgi:hypothetical protein